MSFLLITVAYVISGKLGLMLALPPGYASPIFPPAGIAIAAVLIVGMRSLPWIFLGSLILNVWIGYSASQQIDAMALTVATIIAVASMLQAAIGGWGLRRAIGYPAPLDHSAEVLRFLLLAPAICLTSASLSVSGLLALGIIDPAGFATNWAAWWIGDTLGVVVMLPLVMIAVGEPRALWRSRMPTVAVPMLLVFALFVMIFLKANQWENNDSLMEFRQLSQQTVNQLQARLDEQESVLEQSAALFIHETSGRVTRDEFHRFVEKSLNRFPMIQAVEWAAPVDAAHRAAFEAKQRKDFPGFEIRERNAAGQLQRAGERSSFYPVTYIEPLGGNELALGFDLASNPERQAAITAATQSGTAVMSAAVTLVQERQQQAGVLLLLAVNPHDKEYGTVLTVLRMGDFMDKLLLDTRPMLYTRLVDLDGQKNIYDNFAPGVSPVLSEHSFDFGSRHYRLETAPTPVYFSLHRGWQSWGVLAVGILGTGLLGALFLLGTGYTVRIEAEVKDRTRKLKESESRFRNILDHAPIGMGIAALDGRLMQVNHALCSMLGYKKDELEKLNIRDITHPDDAASSLAKIKQLLDGELDYYRSEKRYLRKDGQVVWAQLASSIERDDSGAPIHLIGQIEDITERKQAEASLRKLSLAVEQSPNSIVITDLDANIQYVNKAFIKATGYSFDEAIGENPRLLHSSKTPGSTYDEMWASLLRGETWEGEFINRRKDGSEYIELARLSPVRQADGSITHYLAVKEDITQRKLAEAELRIAATAFESQEGMMITDADNVILRVNHSFTEITGYTAEDVVGKKPHMLKSGHHDAAFYALMWESIRRDGSWQGEIWNRRKNGEVYPEQLTITEVRGEAGEVSNYVATLNDITLRKAADQQIHNLAFYDALTQLPNRRLLNDRLGQMLAASKRSGRYGALMFLDLDNFKPLNDKYGHDVGDLLLIEVAHRISGCVRETDTVARFGGDEFVVMLSELDEDQAESIGQAGIVAEKIRSTLEESYLLSVQQRDKAESTIEYYCSSSIGVVLFLGHEAKMEDLLKWADQAMYDAKEEGRNKIHFYEAKA
jgi:diguanylate cyclase (GGDEF)-like protein/PAS domain S-box-containing protein